MPPPSQAKAEAAALRAKRPASPTGPPGAAARKEPRAAPPGGDSAERAAFEAALSSFLSSEAGRAAVAAVEEAASEWRNPTLCGVVFTLHDLFARVKEQGGYDAVSRKKTWRAVAASFGEFTETNIGAKARARRAARAAARALTRREVPWPRPI